MSEPPRHDPSQAPHGTLTDPGESCDKHKNGLVPTCTDHDEDQEAPRHPSKRIALGTTSSGNSVRDAEFVVDKKDRQEPVELDDYSREKELVERYGRSLRARQRAELLQGSSFDKQRVSGFPEGNDDVTNSIQESVSTALPPVTHGCSSSEANLRRPSVVDRSPESQRQLSRTQSREASETTGSPRPPATISCGGGSGRHSRKLEKALAQVSPVVLNSIRLCKATISDMQEHPQVAQYLTDCLVVLPNARWRLEIPGKPDVKPATIPARVSSLEPAGGGNTGAQRPTNFEFRLIVCLLPNWQTVPVYVEDISDEPFNDSTTLEFCSYLQHTSLGLTYAEFLTSAAKRKAKQLREFTFTETDVAEILERKRKRMVTAASSGASSLRDSRSNAVNESSLATSATGCLSYRSCYQMREDIAEQIERMKGALQDWSLNSETRRQRTNELRELELELHRLNRQLSQFRASQTPARLPPSVTSTTGSDLFICGGGGGRGSLRDPPTSSAAASAAMAGSLSLSFLDDQGAGSAPSQVTVAAAAAAAAATGSGTTTSLPGATTSTGLAPLKTGTSSSNAAPSPEQTIRLLRAAAVAARQNRQHRCGDASASETQRTALAARLSGSAVNSYSVSTTTGSSAGGLLKSSMGGTTTSPSVAIGGSGRQLLHGSASGTVPEYFKPSSLSAAAMGTIMERFRTVSASRQFDIVKTIIRFNEKKLAAPGALTRLLQPTIDGLRKGRC